MVIVRLLSLSLVNFVAFFLKEEFQKYVYGDGAIVTAFIAILFFILLRKKTWMQHVRGDTVTASAVATVRLARATARFALTRLQPRA